VTALEDQEVLEGVRRGEREALGRFFDAAFPAVYGLAVRLLGDRSAAEDVTQEVFLKVQQAASRFLPDRDPRPWLTRITLNACRDRQRRSAVRRTDRRDPTGLEEVPHPAAPPLDHAVREEERTRLRQALDRLDVDHRSVVLLRDWSGHSHEQIAELLGIRTDAVRKRYSRALERLRGFLGTP